MLYRTLTAVTLSITTLFGALVGGGETTAESTTTMVFVQDEKAPATVSKQSVPDKYEVMLHTQLSTRKVGSVKFWEAVSWCETNHNWDDGGYYSGGLGMAQSVWENFGGKQFASRPSKATKTQQIIVANRVAFLGFQTKRQFRTLDDKLNNRPYLRPAVGWRNLRNWGRDCVNWKTRKPLRVKYTEVVE